MSSMPGEGYVTGCRVSVAFGASLVWSGRKRGRLESCHGADKNVGLELAILGGDDELKWA